jgi:hypothetical protein
MIRRVSLRDVSTNILCLFLEIPLRVRGVRKPIFCKQNECLCVTLIVYQHLKVFHKYLIVCFNSGAFYARSDDYVYHNLHGDMSATGGYR